MRAGPGRRNAIAHGDEALHVVFARPSICRMPRRSANALSLPLKGGGSGGGQTPSA